MRLTASRRLPGRPRRAGRTLRAWRPGLLLPAIGLGLALAGVAPFLPGGWDLVAGVAIVLGAGASLAVAAVRGRGPWRRGWAFLAAWSLPTAALDLWPVLGDPAYDTLASALLVPAAMLLALLGIRQVLQVVYPAGTLLRSAVDAWLYVGSLLAVVLGLVVVPSLAPGRLTGAPVVAAAVYLTVDLTVLTMALELALRSASARRMALLGAAATGLLSAAAAGALVAAGRGDAPGVGAAVCTGAALVLVAAAPHAAPVPRRLGTLPGRTSVARLAGPYVAATTAAAAVGGYWLAGPVHPVALALLASVATVLLVRQALTLLDNVRLVERLAESEQHFRTLVLGSHDVILVANRDGVARYASPALSRVFGYQPADLVGRPVGELVHADDLEQAAARLRAVADGGRDSVRIDARVRRADGTWVHTETTASRSRRGLILNVRDVSDRVALQEELARLAYHDQLTDLPNRALLTERVRAALARRDLAAAAGMPPAEVAVVFLDLDGFKTVNDTSGHEAGDEVLVEAARRLATAVDGGDLVARFGGDEFAVLMHRQRREEVLATTRSLGGALSPLFRAGDRSFTVLGSIGVAFAEPGDDAAGLLRNADLAMYRSKALGKARTEIFTPALLVDAMTHAELAARLSQAVEERSFALLYQPIVDLASEEVRCVEALVRWRSEAGALMSPSELVRLAERSGRIEPLGRWVLGQALAQLARWRAEGIELDLAVNLSAAQVGAPGLVELVREALDRHRVDPERLILEITETFLLEDLDEAARQLRRLKEVGIRLALDDFGSGWSSLAYLRALPVDAVKVDRGFVVGLGRDADSDAVAAAVVRLGHDLGVTVVAEGIETRDQVAHLRRLGFDQGQGFVFSGPLEPAGVADLLGHPGSRTPVPAFET